MPISDIPKAKRRLEKEINELKNKLVNTPSYLFTRINKIKGELNERENILQDLLRLENVFDKLLDTLDKIDENLKE